MVGKERASREAEIAAHLRGKSAMCHGPRWHGPGDGPLVTAGGEGTKVTLRAKAGGLRAERPAGYFFSDPGGKFLNSFSDAFVSFFAFFSGLSESSSSAMPRNTRVFVFESNMSTISVPTR